MKWSRELRVARRSMRTALRAASAIAAGSMRPPVLPRSGGSDLVEVGQFGSNPGRLAMLLHIPPDLMPRAPLLVLLHGCGQTAAGFARQAGWLAFADQLGVPLLLPEQAEENNRGRCFNWFRPRHTGRGLGEALSIRQMIAAAIESVGSDPRKVFVAGLSAGGAMAAALLAAYPDVFAGGATVAGLAVGSAGSVSEALRRMSEAGPPRPASAWAELVRRAGPVGYSGPWPRLSIWHGEADRVVDPANAQLLAEQWSAVHGSDPTAIETISLLGMERHRWHVGDTAVVERWSIPDLAHDWPPGAVAAIASFWGIAGD